MAIVAAVGLAVEVIVRSRQKKERTSKMREKPKLGQTLYSLNIGYAARNREQKLTPVVVTKVGRKYFTCTKDGSTYGTQYRLDDWGEKEEVRRHSKVYSSMKGWEDERDAGKICKKISDAFLYGGNRLKLPVDILRQIDSLIQDSGADQPSRKAKT
jgi:hypothetical protein